LCPSAYEPGISIESLGAAKAIYRPIKYKFHDRDAEQEAEDKKFSNVHILDLKTLTSVLTGEVCSFPTACDIFGAPASRGRKSYSRVPITTPQILERLGVYKDGIRPFTVMTVPFPKRETVADPFWTGYFIMPHTNKLNDLHGRTMVNVVSGEIFHIYDKNSSRLPKPPGWLSLRTMEDEINRILSRAETFLSRRVMTDCTIRWNRVGSNGGLAFLSMAT
jgi:hypothetical protein